MPEQIGLDVDSTQSRHTVVTVTGEIDLSTAPQLREQLLELANNGTNQIIVDLEGVEFIDSTGLGVLVASLNRMRTGDGDLALVCSQPRILRVFEITGLTKVFTIHPSLDEIAAPSA